MGRAANSRDASPGPWPSRSSASAPCGDGGAACSGYAAHASVTGVHVFPTVRISIPSNPTLEDHCAIGDRVILYALGPASVGPRANVSHWPHLCAGNLDAKRAGATRRIRSACSG